MRLARGGNRGLEAAQYVIVQPDRVRQILEAERILGEIWNRQRPGDGSQGDDEVAVLDPEQLLLGLDLHALPAGVERHRAAEDQLCVRAHLPQRNDDMARLERSRGGLREDRRVEHEVLEADGRRAPFAEEASDVATGEAAAEDESSASRCPRAGHPALLSSGHAWATLCSLRGGAHSALAGGRHRQRR
jgi:hypothetical protein